MKLTLRERATALQIAELHQQLLLAHNALRDGIVRNTPANQNPLLVKSQDHLSGIANNILAAALSLETPLYRLMGECAPLTKIDQPDAWIKAVKKANRIQCGAK